MPNLISDGKTSQPRRRSRGFPFSRDACIIEVFTFLRTGSSTDKNLKIKYNYRFRLSKKKLKKI